MYLPQSVPLSRPHVAVWFGKSGKQYDFAVARARPMWLGHPAVYVLVRQERDGWVALFVGRASAAEPQLGGAISPHVEAWEQAMAMGMTHVHLRFEACAEAVSAVEVEDLIRALHPPLNQTHTSEPVSAPLEADAVASAGAGASADAGPSAGGRPLAAAQLLSISAWIARVGGAATAAPPSAADRRARWLPRARWPSRLSWADWLHLQVPWTGLLAAIGSPRSAAIRAAVRDGTAAATVPPPPAEHAVSPSGGASADDFPAETFEVGEPTVLEPVPAAPLAAEPVAAPQEAAAPDSSGRARLGLGEKDVVVLFAGELAFPTGADLVVDAMATVHGDPAPVRLILAGEGPLRGDLESRARHGGYAHCCRFLGDVSAADFNDVLAASDAVIIPARTAQDGGFAAAALAAGKPVLTTHQARIEAVVHGENGFVTYDNTGSMVWVLREVVVYLARRAAPPALAA
jgi:glycosyltransferase involved in cell wall biosynthesis